MDGKEFWDFSINFPKSYEFVTNGLWDEEFDSKDFQCIRVNSPKYKELSLYLGKYTFYFSLHKF